jgi:serine/threonine protein kinase
VVSVNESTMERVSDRQRQTAVMDDTILAGHYQVVRHLGGGGFGQTFLARDSHLPGKPLCVVKQLKPRATEPANLEIAKRLFDREAETLYRLGDHNQIPRLLAHFEQDQEFYLVQEYIAGQSFDRELHHNERFNEDLVINLLQDILQVLSFVHQQHVIHRDIKPSNLIRRSKDDKIVLIDFGAVKQVSHQTLQGNGQTSMTIAIGSPGYMPSEQRAFHPHYSSDIYAVGVVCMQALTGLAPSDLPIDSHTGELSCASCSDRAVIDPDLAAILDKMVRYDYRQRYANATEALRALQNLLGQQPRFEETAPAIFPSLQPLAGETEAMVESPIPNPPANPQPVSQPRSQPTPNFTQPLSNHQQKQLEHLLAEEIGPISTMVLRQAMSETSTPRDLLDRLVTKLPEPRRVSFREKAKSLFATDQSSTASQILTELPTASTTPQPAADAAIAPEFIKRCEIELAKAIGPIASLMVKRALAQYPTVNNAQLIDLLVKHLPNAAAEAAFRQALK